MTSGLPPTTPPPPHLLGALRTLWVWRKPILLTTLAGTVLSIIVSLLLPVYYESSTAFVAISPDQNTLEGIFGGGNGRVQFYGNGDDVDRLLAMAESDELVDYMVDVFDLYEVYDIDSTELRAPIAVRKELLSNLEVEKTPRDVIRLSVQDQDPQRAAAMAKAARDHLNELGVNVGLSSQYRTLISLREDVGLRDSTLNIINDSLATLREKSGVYNPSAQSTELSKKSASLTSNIADIQARLEIYRRQAGRVARDSVAALTVRLAGQVGARTMLDSQLININQSLGPIYNMEEERTRLNTALTYDRIRMKKLEALFSADQRVLEVIEEARVPVIKSRPIRSLIVLGGMLFSFFAAVVGALLLQGSRRYDWSEVFK